jgi:murein peptide amidase A
VTSYTGGHSPAGGAGHSIEGRVIEWQGSGPLLVFGAIHGDEPASAELCRRWAARGAGIVVPVVNPDGLARGTKDNARGVDLNRNFAARNWSREHPPGYFPGDQPLSEPESAALAALIDERAPRLIVSVHQPFGCVNWDGPAASLAEEMARACGYPARASIGYPTPGSFGSAYGVDRGLPVITLELPAVVEEPDYLGCLRALDCAMLWAACPPPT